MPETAAEKKARRKAEKEEKKKAAAAEKLALEQEQAANDAPPEDDKNDAVPEVPAPQSDIPLHELNKMAHKSQLARKKAEAKARR